MSAEHDVSADASETESHSGDVHIVVDSEVVEPAVEAESTGADAEVDSTVDADATVTSSKDTAGAAATDESDTQAATAADLAALSTDELKKLTYESCKFRGMPSVKFRTHAPLPQTRRATLSSPNWCISRNQNASTLRTTAGMCNVAGARD